MKRAERSAQWVKHIEGWKKSGLTQPRYCERELISYETFKRWRQRLRSGAVVRGSAPRFVPVRISAAPASGPMSMDSMSTSGRAAPWPGAQIQLANGRAICLGAQLDEVELGRLVRLLEVLPC